MDRAVRKAATSGDGYGRGEPLEIGKKMVGWRHLLTGGLRGG